jgi:hypothetical protein
VYESTLAVTYIKPKKEAATNTIPAPKYTFIFLPDLLSIPAWDIWVFETLDWSGASQFSPTP